MSNTGITHVSWNRKDIYSQVNSAVQSHSGIVRSDSNLVSLSDMVITHNSAYCTLYDNITTMLSCQMLSGSMPHDFHPF